MMPGYRMTGMSLNKKQLAAQLKEVANLLELLGEDAFRARAFMTAARNIENFEGDVAQLLQEDRLSEIKGIGSGLAAELAALKTQESLPLLEELKGRVPEGVRSLFMVSGLGAKKIAALWQSGIVSLEDLVAAAQAGRIASMKGFGKKSAENILVAAQFALNARKRMHLNVALKIAQLVIEAITQALPQARAEIAGSLRRGLETIGDINLLITGVKAPQVAKALENIVQVKDLSESQLTVLLDGRTVQIIISSEAAFGASLAFYTGNYEYRRMLLERAAELGYELREDGLFQADKLTETKSEVDLFEKLKLPFIQAERREQRQPKPTAQVITLADMHGLVHNHSSWSDAVNSIREMVSAARAKGYNYLAMADHSQSSYYANGLSAERVFAQAKEIAEIRRELADEGSDFGLLHGIEVDIMTDGSLDYPDEVLAVLDYTVVSVHQNFSLSESKQTARIIRAVQNPYAGILGHATGRLLLRRPGYQLDLQAVIEACAESNTVIEINAHPYRLDLDWRWVIKARELGCKFSINPDAHHIDGFDDLRYGVIVARKAGLSKVDVVNTAPTAEQFLRQLKSSSLKSPAKATQAES